MFFVLVKAEESRDYSFILAFLLPNRQGKNDDYAQDQGWSYEPFHVHQRLLHFSSRYLLKILRIIYAASLYNARLI